MKFRNYIIILFFLSVTVNSGCKKYLDAKSNQALVVITSLQDLQSLLDNNNQVNRSSAGADEVSTDEYYLTYTDYQALPLEQMRNMYTWQPNNLFYPYTNITNDWTQTYNSVYIANTVLDNIDKIPRTNDNAVNWDNVKGQALFLRAYCFYKAASIWSLAYDNNTSDTDLGIPLRLNSDFNEPSKRSTVSETYSQIISDTQVAKNLLVNTSAHVYRSSKPAAYALFARIYLSMRKYELAGLYADSCLQTKNTLINYSTLNASEEYPIHQFNTEVIYDSQIGGIGYAPMDNYQARINDLLYASYSPNDLRKSMFFLPYSDIPGTMYFRGSYEGSYSFFNGLATDEIYLIRAECYARAGNYLPAMTDLNTLLAKRYSSFVPLTASNSSDALSRILTERQKELIMRGTRWTDLKRLNKEGAEITLTRVVDETTYTLPPNDLRYALPIPDDVISLTGMQQNRR